MHKAVIKAFLLFATWHTMLIAILPERDESLLKDPQYSDQQLKDKKNLVHCAIIGSGVAGLSAFIYGARAGFHTILFQGDKPGGLVMDAPYIENWPGIDKMAGVHIMERLERQARSYCPYILPETVKRVNFSAWPFELVTTSGMKVYALSVVIATGAYLRKLGIEGEETYWRKGVLSCTTCDAPFSKKKRTVVVGSNDTAIERALQLAPYARSITIISKDKRMQAAPSMQKKLQGFKHIQVLYNKQITKIEGDGKYVTGIEFFDLTTRKKSFLDIDLVFLSGAVQPNSELFKGQLPIDEDGTIMLKCRSQETSIPGVTAAGTVADPHYRQAGVAAGDGIKAALDSINFLCKLGFDGPRRNLIENNLFVPALEQYRPLEKIQSSDSFFRTIRTTQRPVVVEFYSALCSTCRRMEPLVESIGAEYAKQAQFFKVDITKLGSLVDYYRINALPTFIIFKRGRVQDRIEGEKTKDQIRQFVKKYIQ